MEKRKINCKVRFWRTPHLSAVLSVVKFFFEFVAPFKT
jgi:hypothetical protein